MTQHDYKQTIIFMITQHDYKQTIKLQVMETQGINYFLDTLLLARFRLMKSCVTNDTTNKQYV